jgi:hypothetical protein
VVWDDVYDEAEISGGEGGGEGLEGWFAAKLGVNLGMIGDVVAMEAAGAGAPDG